jgi:hypothetical protein
MEPRALPILNEPLNSEFKILAGHQWLMPIILATQETEIKRIMVRSQPRQIVHKPLSRKYPSQKGLAEWLKVKALISSPRTANKQTNKQT